MYLLCSLHGLRSSARCAALRSAPMPCTINRRRVFVYTDPADAVVLCRSEVPMVEFQSGPRTPISLQCGPESSAFWEVWDLRDGGPVIGLAGRRAHGIAFPVPPPLRQEGARMLRRSFSVPRLSSDGDGSGLGRRSACTDGSTSDFGQWDTWVGFWDCRG